MSIDRNAALEALRHMQDRQSVRNFADKPIPQEDLDEILKTALSAATAGNLQRLPSSSNVIPSATSSWAFSAPTSPSSERHPSI